MVTSRSEHPTQTGDRPGDTPPAPVDSRVSMEAMRRLDLFASLGDDDLETLYQLARTVRIPAGHLLMEQGQPGDSAYVVVDGELEVSLRRADRKVVLAVRGTGDLLGEMSLLGGLPRSASVRALRATTLLEITRDALDTLIACSRTARWSVLTVVASRLRGTQSVLQQQEKYAQLGNLAADLAHEINNPAAAIRRSVGQLRETLSDWDRLGRQMAEGGLDPQAVAAVAEIRRRATERATHPPSLDAVLRGDREDALLEWLENADVPKAWDLAPALAAGGWEVAEIEDLVEPLPAALRDDVVRLVATTAEAYGILDEIGRAAEGISERVRVVKEYAYLDQAPIQEIDVHQGLENTLVLVRPKLVRGIEIVREYGEDVPHIEAYGAELNQVWTNLIDNALDAMGEQGTLRLRTLREDDSVVVEIADTGPGIPPEILDRIFTVGFTTKPPGQGTGRGLHIARNIVEDKHRGKIGVESGPGGTTFRVVLPVRLASHAQQSAERPASVSKT